ncbi:MAG: histidine kinase [Deltaproteobacteria bacterium]|nr:histidine kinase [Deltaproteobacteria bacterium]
MRLGELTAETLRALITPRRAIPILLVAVPLLIAQNWFFDDPSAVILGIVMCLTFLLIAPLSWRALLPLGRPLTFVLLRLAAYGLIGLVVVYVVGVRLNDVLGLPGTFLSSEPSLLIVLGMFWVGGWGLGRDIDMEVSLLREQQRAEALAREAERAELLAIRSHLDPHFLFNTLNAIAEWCREDGEVAERALLKLSDMLRTVLSAVQAQSWSLRRELDLVDGLADLYRVRDPERFVLERAGWDDVDEVMIPPMLLLSLAENAFKHGPAAGHSGPLRLEVARRDDEVRITLENPGPFEGPRVGGQGLDLVRRRLTLTYGDLARFHIGAAEGRTRAELNLPVRPAGEGTPS